MPFETLVLWLRIAIFAKRPCLYAVHDTRHISCNFPDTADVFGEFSCLCNGLPFESYSFCTVAFLYVQTVEEEFKVDLRQVHAFTRCDLLVDIPVYRCMHSYRSDW